MEKNIFLFLHCNPPFLFFIILSPLIIHQAGVVTTMAAAEGSLSCANSVPNIPATPLISFLERVQETALNTLGSNDFDPKLYVDKPLKFNLSTTEENFNNLIRFPDGSVSVHDFNVFITNSFGTPEDELGNGVLKDFVPEPEGFLPKVKNTEVRTWALKVHSLWNKLSRKVSDDVERHPELHTLLPLPNPVIIPGSRFREVYYWDSYWVIRGLLASKMHVTAKGIVGNLISLLDKYGHVLNGARVYYTNRSQPPLLSSMIYDIYKRTGDAEFLKRSLPALHKEHHFWTSGIHKVIIQDDKGCNHTLSRYYAMWDKPRPESSTIDKKSASKFLNSCDKRKFYCETATTAESGWDFSTRWMRNVSDPTTLATTSILPVDLNAFILKMELDIASMEKAVGDQTSAKHYLELARERKKAMTAVFWNPRMQQWLDYWLDNSSTCKSAQVWDARNQNQNVFASNFIPLWIESFYSDGDLVETIMKSLQKSGLVCAAGIATSLRKSGQQWDYPNGWAPLQHMIVEGLVRSGSKKARAMAEDIAGRWIRTSYAGYKKTGAMQEKYDVEVCGKSGDGGEYISQTGFGWTNGVVLAFLEEFGWPEGSNIGC